MLAAAPVQPRKVQGAASKPDGQNTVVPAAGVVAASASAGGTLALVPALAKRGAEGAEKDDGDRSKAPRRG